MTRSILAVLAAVVAVTVLSGTGCQSSGIGDPCVPEQEYDTSYLGATITEVKAESKSYQCQSFLCLANHFQGRVTCPYGQSSYNNGDPTKVPYPCSTPLGQPVTGTAGGTPGGPANDPYVFPCSQGQQPMPGSPSCGDTVLPNCTNRSAANTVYCSCRCANVDGKTDDGANYCTCPDGFSCTPLISSIGGGSFTGLTGSYCVKAGTAYNENNPQGCSLCDPTSADCGSAQGVVAK